MDELVARLRAAGCVFAENEARLLTEAADVSHDIGARAEARVETGAETRPGPGTGPTAAAAAGPTATATATATAIMAGRPADPDRLERLVAARIGGAPLEQVLGWAEFWGRRWTVAPGVFVPRRRSELLVREALSGYDAGRLNDPPQRAVVVDLCCGCGALGGSVALALTDAGHDVELHASDVDPAATECARTNLANIGIVHDGDLDAPLPGSLRGRVDVLLCNAPYVPTDAIDLMPREARDHEPHTALDGGADGLDILRRAIATAATWLRPGEGKADGKNPAGADRLTEAGADRKAEAGAGGVLLFEVGQDQAAAAEAAVREAELIPRTVSDDTLGATVITARRR